MLDSANVDACWQAHINGERDHARDLWPVLMFQAWQNEAMRPSSPANCLSHQIELSGA
jgi:asparagine synthase (glutamine-hydrolysing)